MICYRFSKGRIKKIFIHAHHNNYGDPENESHVHIEDNKGSNSYSLNGGYLLQSYRSIDRKTESWFFEQYSMHSYEWLAKWNTLGADWIDDLNLDAEKTKTIKK